MVSQVRFSPTDLVQYVGEEYSPSTNVAGIVVISRLTPHFRAEAVPKLLLERSSVPIGQSVLQEASTVSRQRCGSGALSEGGLVYSLVAESARQE